MPKTGELMRCCICCKHKANDDLYDLAISVDMSNGKSSCTIAEMIETVASIKLKPVPQSICESCWSYVNEAHLIRDQIRRSKYLQRCSESEHDNDTIVEIAANFEILAEDSSVKFPDNNLPEEDYESEYLDEYLEPTKSDDHTYDNPRDEEAVHEEEEEVEEECANPKNIPSSKSILLDASVVQEKTVLGVPCPSDLHITRQFVEPRSQFILRDEYHTQYRLLEVTGERCCGCSFVAGNRKELLQHSETVHAIDITDIGDYCPMCFYKFATDRHLERHMEEFKSTLIYVCLQCNRFYNLRQKMFNHLLKCGESIDVLSPDESDAEENENPDNDEEYYEEIIEDTYSDMNSPVNDSLTEAYQRKMMYCRALFDEIVSNGTSFSCKLDEAELNVQDFQIIDQCSFETFKFVRLRGERCCGCSYTCATREQLMQHGKVMHVADKIIQDDLTCCLCGSQFHEESEMVRHLSFFTSKELFFCTICHESFLSRESLKTHQQTNESHIEMFGSGKFVELDMPLVMEQLDRLQAEKNINRPKYIRCIPMPEERFIQNITKYKNYSVLTVVGQRCCGCGKFFDTLTDLKQHSQQEHTTSIASSWISDQLQCDICYAVFDFERGLILHKSTRRNNKTNLYLCKLCGLLFTKKYCLARHMQFAPNHLSELIVHASGRGASESVEVEDEKGPEDTEMNDPPELDPRVSEALQLHKSVQRAGLEKVGHFVGYHCCFSKCTATFSNEEDLVEHSRDEHNGKRLENETERKSDKNVCPSCCKSYQDLAKLSWHRFHRFIPRQYNCKHCDKTFDKYPKLKLHVDTKHSESPSNYVCSVCDKSFVLNSRLKAHMKLHTTQKDYACDICGDKFRSNGLLKRHRRSVHSTERPYECKHCPKRFRVIEKFKIHQRVHTGEKPFECTYCQRTFSHFTDRKRHIMTAHTGERPFKCSYCPAAYIRNRELTLHMQKHKDIVQNEAGVMKQESCYESG
ncbi:AGAP009339-PA-like protein [Anopheles sinensis]|uniref:AGAP009339-PA-like protein n=1 Tax=Anopheles sinensis TaxID=74873 RepID=A0A084VM34_ANOSI|nr:AGAP009339-PA-like protein [Anopheles sinensis]